MRLISARRVLRPDFELPHDALPNFGSVPEIVGEVVAVRGDVLQIRPNSGKGLTRGILSPKTNLYADDRFKVDALKPGTKLSGYGVTVEGTGVGDIPLRVEADVLHYYNNTNNSSSGSAPLLRGKRPPVFVRVNYSGKITFTARVKTVRPLVLADDLGEALPITFAKSLILQRVGMRPLKTGEIKVGTRLRAVGKKAPDGLTKAKSILLMGRADDLNEITGTLKSLDKKGLKIQPRFSPDVQTLKLSPSAKAYDSSTLDLDSIQVGDTLNFTGKVMKGTTVEPAVLMLKTISPNAENIPVTQSGGNLGEMFGAAQISATVSGKIIAFDPLRVQTPSGSEVVIIAPGQLRYLHYKPAVMSQLKPGVKLLVSGRSKAGVFTIETVILNPPSGRP